MTKKTTSALAIAALVASGAASAATIQIDESTSVSVGFNMFPIYKSVTNDAGEDETTFTDNAGGFVLSGEHTANGLTSFVNFDIDGFSLEAANDGLTLDEANAGVAGDFGTLTIGSDGAVYDSYVDSIMDGDEVGNVYAIGNGDKSRIVRYDSNDMSGLNFSIEAQIAGDGNTSSTSEVNFTTGGATVVDTQSGSGSTGASVAVGASYDLGTVALHGSYDMREVTTGHEIYGFGVTTNVAGVDLGASYQEDTDPNREATLLGLSAGYNYGAGSVYGRVGYTDFATGVDLNQVSAALGLDNSTDSGTAGLTDSTDANQETGKSFTQYLVGANYNITDSAYIYAEYLNLDREKDQGNAVAVGTNIFF